jgi:hypothetical protein
VTETVMDWLDRSASSWDSEDCLVFPFSIGSHGYGQFNDGSRCPSLAHRYVCLKFHGIPSRSTMHAAHSCGNKTCVNPKHIRWASRSENEGDKKQHGRDNAGQRHGMSKLTAETVSAIRSAPGFQKDIAAQFGISRQHVSDIKGGRRWTHLT